MRTKSLKETRIIKEIQHFHTNKKNEQANMAEKFIPLY